MSNFSNRTTEELIRIAAAGGGFMLNATRRPTDDLIKIAAAGASKAARLTFAGLARRPTNELVMIAAAGRGCVDFIARPLAIED